MSRKKNWLLMFNIVLIASMLIVASAIVIAASSISINFDGLKAAPLDTVNDEWYVLYPDGNMEEFSQFGEVLDTNEIRLSRIFLFDRAYWKDTLNFFASNAAVEVYQDGNLVYSQGFEGDMEKQKLMVVGYDVHCLLQVAPESASEIVVVLKSPTPLTISSFYFGSSDDVMMNCFRKSFPVLFFFIISMTMSVTMGVVGFFGRKRNIVSRSFILFLLLMTVCSFWMVSNVRLLPGLGFNPIVIGIITLELFLLIPMVFSAFLYVTFNNLKTLDLVAFVVSFINLIVLNVLHFSAVASIVQTLYVTLVILLLCLGIMLIQLVVDYAKERPRPSPLIGIGMLTMFVGVVIQGLLFMRDREINLSWSFIICLMVFNLTQMVLTIRKFFSMVDEGQKAGNYLNMAKTDPLTGLGNRRALDLYITEISNTSASLLRVGCIVCDLNDLKLTNDVYGHVVGDQLIKDFANCLSVCFENRGIPFRTGGDEFYVLFSDVEVDMSAMMKRLAIGLEGTNTSTEYKVSCSSGCYADYVPSHNEAAIWDIIKFADAEMYKQKKMDRQVRLEALANKSN